MALTEQEEFELLSLEREKFMQGGQGEGQQVQTEQGMEAPVDKRKQAEYRTSAQAANILNTMLMGAPQAIAQKGFGQDFVNEADLAPGDKMIGQVLGSILPMGAAAKGVGGLIKGIGKGKNILRGLVSGAAGGAAAPVENFDDLKERGRNAIIGGAFGAAISLGAEGIGAIKKILSGAGTAEQEAGLLENIRKDFRQVKQNAVDMFGSKVARLAETNPEAVTLEAEDLFQTLKNNPEEFKDALPIIKKIPGLKEVIDDPSKASKLTAGKLQEWINHIQEKIPKNVKSSNLDLIDFTNDLRAAQLDAFPEMAQYRSEYRSVIEPYNQLKNQFKFNRLQNAIQNDFGGSEGIKALKQLLPEETIDKMGGYKKAVENAKFAKDILERIVKGAAVAGGATAVGGAGVAAYKHFNQ